MSEDQKRQVEHRKEKKCRGKICEEITMDKNETK